MLSFTGMLVDGLDVWECADLYDMAQSMHSIITFRIKPICVTPFVLVTCSCIAVTVITAS